MSLDARLSALSTALLDPKLLRGRGLGNEIGFYIFDYAAERGPDVALALPRVIQNVEAAGVRVAVVDLYRTLLDMLEARGYLEKAAALEGPQVASVSRSAE